MICRPTQKEAEEYHHYIVHEMGDWQAVDFIMGVRKDSHSFPPDKIQALRERFTSGTGTFLVLGSPDTVVAKFKELSDAGLDGMAIGLVNFLDGCAVSLPCHARAHLPTEAPVGLMVSGPAMSDRRILAVSAAVERALATD